MWNIEFLISGIGNLDVFSKSLRQASIKARNEDLYLKDILFDNNQIKERFTREELEEIFDTHKYIGQAVEQVENLVEFLKNKYKF